jgi:hypothetical protein
VPKLVFTPTAAAKLAELESDSSAVSVFKAVRKALGYLEMNPRHPSLQTHEYTSIRGARGEKIFEAYAQNQTPGAYRIFWHYGPDKVVRGKPRVAVVTIIAITSHP